TDGEAEEDVTYVTAHLGDTASVSVPDLVPDLDGPQDLPDLTDPPGTAEYEPDVGIDPPPEEGGMVLDQRWVLHGLLPGADNGGGGQCGWPRTCWATSRSGMS